MIKEKERVALISIFAAIFLTGFKLVVGIITGSLGILSEALRSALDLVAAVITYFSVRISDKPAYKNHNYGHGKIENFSAFIETILLVITCTWILYEAIERLISGKTEIEINIWSYIVIISSIIIDINRSQMLSKAAKKYNSQALEADALHFSTDIWSSTVVLFGLICANFGFFFADSVAALVVALIVLVVSYKLGKKAMDVLLDKAPQDTINIVEQKIATFPFVKHFHNLKVRTSGADTFIKFNIHLDPDLPLKQVHNLCDKIETEISSTIARSEIFIHAEPHDLNHIEIEENEDLNKII